jgi:hypothetical protein
MPASAAISCRASECLSAISDQGRIDLKLVFLLRAAARFDLVGAGAMDLDEAFDGLIDQFRAIAQIDRIDE